MFYTLVEIVAVNAFNLSTFSYVPTKSKFADHAAFREALCEGLFAHTKLTSDTAGIGDIAGIIGMHQRVKFERAPCVICKQAAEVERRGIKGIRRQVFQELSANIVSRRKDRHVSRATSGCCFCKVALCRKRGCWEAFHQ